MGGPPHPRPQARTTREKRLAGRRLRSRLSLRPDRGEERALLRRTRSSPPPRDGCSCLAPVPRPSPGPAGCASDRDERPRRFGRETRAPGYAAVMGQCSSAGEMGGPASTCGGWSGATVMGQWSSRGSSSGRRASAEVGVAGRGGARRARRGRRGGARRGPSRRRVGQERAVVRARGTSVRSAAGARIGCDEGAPAPRPGLCIGTCPGAEPRTGAWVFQEAAGQAGGHAGRRPSAAG